MKKNQVTVDSCNLQSVANERGEESIASKQPRDLQHFFDQDNYKDEELRQFEAIENAIRSSTADNDGSKTKR